MKMVITSHDRCNTGRKTDISQRAIYVFKDAGVKSHSRHRRYKQRSRTYRSHASVREGCGRGSWLDKTVRTRQVCQQDDFDTAAMMWDLAEDKHSIKLIESFLAAGKSIAIVCHYPRAPCDTSKRPRLLVHGKEVTGFTDGEEAEHRRG